MGPPRRIDPTTNRTSTHGKCFRLPGFTANNCKNGFLLVRLHFYQVSLVVHIDISENKNNIVKDMYLYNIKKNRINFFIIIIVERERNVLFNDALNTFYLRLYGVRHMVKDHSDSEKGNPLPPHRLLLSINSKGSFICTIP